jgi:hypothetical protein
MGTLLEYQKAECLLNIDSFDEPAKLSHKRAWVQQIQHLLFMKKGTYPSNPELGIGLQNYDYAFIDDAIPKLRDDITEQIRTYFPDMPFDSVTLISQNHSSKKEKILVMVFNFSNNASNNESVVVASTKTSSRIDFEISI